MAGRQDAHFAMTPRTPPPPVNGIDVEKWNALIVSARDTGSVSQEELVRVLHAVEITEEILSLIVSVFNSIKIEIEDDSTPLAAPRPVRRASIASNTEDSVNIYLNEIGRVDLLTAEQERELGRQIEEGQTCQARLQVEELEGGERRRLERKVESGRQARKVLIEANLRLVVSIARKYDRHGVPLMDLVQEGNIGLMRATEKYDHSKGFKFSTYATWWIRQAISRAIPDQGRSIRIPAHMSEYINQVNRAHRDLLRDLDREPTIEEIAERCNVTVERVAELQQMAGSIASLDSKIGDEPDSASLGDQIGDEEAEDPADTAELADLRRAVHLVLDELDERDQEIIKMRFGIECEPHTLDEVARRFNVTRERIRQIESRTLARLRHPHNSKRLRSFVDPA